MYSVGIIGSLKIAHALKGNFGKESRPHQHRYRFEWSLRAKNLDDQGFAADIARMEAIRDRLIKRMNGIYLNDVAFFEGIQPSLENFATFFLQELLKEFSSTGPVSQGIYKSTIQVWESNTAWASYEQDVAGTL